MTFVIPFDQPLDIRSHGTQQLHGGNERFVRQADKEINHLLDGIMALCRIFDVIKQLSRL
jgi:hypothetical protein